MIRTKIKNQIEKAVKKITEDNLRIELSSTTNPIFGDYTSNIALQLAKKLKKNSIVIANEIVSQMEKIEEIEKAEVVKPGFINFWLSKKFLCENAMAIAHNNYSLPSYHLGKNKKIMIEYAQPNTHKLFHIGHLRNIIIGESLARIFEAVGNKVIRTNYQGDVGLHIAKTLYSILKNITMLPKLKTIEEKIDFIGKMYVLGNQKYEEDEKAKEEIIKINQAIYNQNDEQINKLWQETRQWSLEYFDKIYKRVDTVFDRLYFESEMTKRAIELIKVALSKKILEKSQGAIIFNGKKYNLDTRVFLNSLGYPTYEGKELALCEKEFSDFGEIDRCIHLTTPEQKSFFAVTFKVEELLFPQTKEKQFHLAYEWVELKTGKMSSRIGNIIEANWLIDQVKKRLLEKFNLDEKKGEILAVSAIKYSFLKNSVQTKIDFDIDESINLEGNSAPYLLYTYVRCYSIIKKLSQFKVNQLNIKHLNQEEIDLMRKIYWFSEVILQSAQQLSPNLIANYLYQLASLFNLFYQKHPVIKADQEKRKIRIIITYAVKNILEKGMFLLGIKTVDKM
jgi:arginyl-tRNA synthetase